MDWSQEYDPQSDIEKIIHHTETQEERYLKHRELMEEMLARFDAAKKARDEHNNPNTDTLTVDLENLTVDLITNIGLQQPEVDLDNLTEYLISKWEQNKEYFNMPEDYNPREDVYKAVVVTHGMERIVEYSRKMLKEKNKLLPEMGDVWQSYVSKTLVDILELHDVYVVFYNRELKQQDEMVLWQFRWFYKRCQ